MISGLYFYHVCIKGGVKKHRDRVHAACGRARRHARQASKTASEELDWVEMRVASDAIVSHSHAKDSPALLGAAGWGDTRCHVVGEGPEAQRQVLHLDVLVVVDDVNARALVGRHRRLQLAADVLGGVPILWVITRDNAAWRVASRAAHREAGREARMRERRRAAYGQDVVRDARAGPGACAQMRA